MTDREKMEIIFVGEDEGPCVVLRGSREAVKAAARLIGAPVAIVPTEGEAFEAMVERSARAADRAFDAIVRIPGIVEPPAWEDASPEYRANAIAATRASLLAALGGEDHG